MSKKNLWLDVLISAGLWLAALGLSCGLDRIASAVSSDALTTAAIIMLFILFLAGAVVTVRFRHAHILTYPTVTAVIHIICIACGIIELVSQFNELGITNSDAEGWAAFISIVAQLGGAIIVTVLTAFLFLVVLVLFGLAVAAGAITKKIIGKNIPIINNNEDYTLKGSN